MLEYIAIIFLNIINHTQWFMEQIHFLLVTVFLQLEYFSGFFYLEQDEESIPVTYRELPEYKELLEFKKLKKQKLQQMHAESGFVQHVGFKVSARDVLLLLSGM